VEQEPGPIHSRRRTLALLGTFGATGLAGCTGDTSITVTGVPSSVASLASLTLSAGTLTPAFAPATTSYAASVADTVASVTVTAVPTHAGANIRVHGVLAGSGVPSAPIVLAQGGNPVNVVVTAQDGVTTATYAVNIVRGAAGMACVLIPQETEGPFPLLAVLSNATIVRQNITEGRPGVPMTFTLTLMNVNNNCLPIAGAAVYVWQCDKDGVYSGYAAQPGGANTLGQTFLRGVLTTNASGQVAFTTIFPGWYAGRITHVHFQVYLGGDTGRVARATSQVAFPPAVTSAVYASPLYAARGQNTSVAGFGHDSVFSDGTTFQLATVTGDVASALNATLNVGIAV
jgi:protocatechuate 3,4-dioxygenase beta subunit